MDARRPLFKLTSVLLLAAQLAGSVPALAATAPAKPATTGARPTGLVSRARGYYRDARYDEAVGLLAGPTLRKELTGDELREAQIVLARCYVKKGMVPRAKEYFGAILAADPSFVLDPAHADAEEMAVFNQVKGASGSPPATAAGTPAAPDGKTSAAPAPPQLHKPTPGPAEKPKSSWLSRNKYLAIAIVAGGAVVAGLAAGGGGGGSPTPSTPASLPGFPSPPGGH